MSSSIPASNSQQTCQSFWTNRQHGNIWFLTTFSHFMISATNNKTIYLHSCLFLSLSLFLHVSLPFCLSVTLLKYLPSCLFLCLSVTLFIYPTIVSKYYNNFWFKFKSLAWAWSAFFPLMTTAHTIGYCWWEGQTYAFLAFAGEKTFTPNKNQPNSRSVQTPLQNQNNH